MEASGKYAQVPVGLTTVLKDIEKYHLENNYFQEKRRYELSSHYDYSTNNHKTFEDS